MDAVKPHLTFEKITFSNGETFEFEQDEIVVFVGPNNAGKSAALKEMQNFVARNVGQVVIKDVNFRKVGNKEDLDAYLKNNASITGSLGNYYYAGIGYNIHQSHIFYFDNPGDRHPVASFFCARLATETRITESNPAGAIALYKDPPSHPIHLLLMDNELAKKVSDLFRHAFGKDLIVMRAGGGSFPLYVGDRPGVDPGDDELSRAFVEKLRRDCVPLETQGDGMRSFASVMLHALISDNHSIQLLDEPEAFLHPPQARLIGSFIARERVSRSQLFIATHSTDILDGLIDGGVDKIRIIRIQRDGDINRVKELSRDKTRAIVNDTLSRYSGVFEGIFYQHVVICESDSDCMFYSSILNSKAVSGDRRADVLFIHAAGKHRMYQLAETLCDLDVPVSVIVDIDILKEEVAFRKLFEVLGGHWEDVSEAFTAIKTSIEERRVPLNAEQVKRMICDALKEVSGIDAFPKKVEQEIKKIFNTQSSWDDVKRAGRAALSSGQPVKHFDALCEASASRGLWIVPVGELEGFCRSAQGGHGPGFVANILEERDIETDPELELARDFVAQIWRYAQSVRG